MNWYKIAQNQNLLFYPWDKPVERVRPRVEPEWVNEDSGEVWYRCIDCGEPLEEDDIILWDIMGQETKPYVYPLYNMVPGKVVQQYNQILPILKEYYQQFIQDWGVQKRKQQAEGDESDYWSYEWDKNYKLPATEIVQLLKSSPDLMTYNEFVQNTMVQDLGASSLVKLLATFSGNKFSDNGFLSGYELKRLAEYPPAPLSLKEVEHSIRYYKHFAIQTEGPVCEDCATTCVGCGEGIPSDQQSYELGDYSSDVICEKCLSSGTYGMCADCGKIFYADELQYIEDEGDFCEECYKDRAPLYENFEDTIALQAEQNEYPFHAWFNDGDPEGKQDKVTIPWVDDEGILDIDQQVIYLLNDLGYAVSLADYRQGYATNEDGRKTRIGKIIERWTKKNLKINENSQLEPWRKIEEKEDHLHAGQEMLNNFVNSDFRKAKNIEDKMIAISENPRDVAAMSTERRWKSCMELGVGSQYADVFCEVATGGLIAYLVRKGDDEIRDPVARVLIRRYENSEGKSIAKVEGTYYGTAPHGFVSQVEDWVESKQGVLPKGSGPYEIQGMEYRDDAPKTVNAFRRLKQLIKAAALKGNWYRRGK